MWLALLLAPAYAEVNCLNGHYTGWRYRFTDDPIVHQAALHEGTTHYMKNVMAKVNINQGCLYA